MDIDNVVYWAAENPKIRHTNKTEKSQSLTVWDFFRYRGLIAYHSLEENANADRHCDILNKNMVSFLTNSI